VKNWFSFVATVLSVLALCLGQARTAYAGAATEVVRTKQTALFELIKKPATPDNKKKIEAMFDEMLDYAGLAEASLGAEWGARTDAEKAEFSGILDRCDGTCRRHGRHDPPQPVDQPALLVNAQERSDR